MLNGGEVVGAANDENVVSNGHDRTSFCESFETVSLPLYPNSLHVHLHSGFVTQINDLNETFEIRSEDLELKSISPSDFDRGNLFVVSNSMFETNCDDHITRIEVELRTKNLVGTERVVRAICEEVPSFSRIDLTLFDHLERNMLRMLESFFELFDHDRITSGGFFSLPSLPLYSNPAL
jgi:hypothetical protein